jgi:O-antigen ligase
LNYQLSADSERQRAYSPFIDKANGPVGMVLLALAAIGIGLATLYGGLVAGLLLLVAMIAIPVVYAVVVYPIFGIVVLLTMGFFLFFILRLGINFPLGTLMDGLEALLIVGFLIKLKQKGDWSVETFKNPVSITILIWIGYNLIQVANPWAESRLAWVYTVRSVAAVTIMYFVFVYYLRSVKAIRIVLKTWLVLAVCGAIYGFKQEFIGIAPGELADLWSDPMQVSLLYINGAWRKYSIFSDPVSFSYTMVGASLICVALLSGRKSWPKRIVLVLMIFAFLLAMLYSGTRGAYVLVPASLIPFALLNFSKKIMFASCVAAVFIIILIIIPTSNPTIARFQTAFRPSDDASFNVRKANQKRIQPYILSHPIGGGLGSTGAWGARFAPNSFLATFPPDSGYIRVAVELGWIGLLLFCFLMYSILKMGITNFYRIKNQELRIYCLAMTLVIFSLNIGNFPQEALVQFPNNILFYIAAAIVHTTYLIDKREGQTLSGENSL